MHSSLVKLCTLSAFALAGCGASPRSVVEERAAREFSCPTARIDVEELATNSFRVRACGNSATYSCLGGNPGNPFAATCTREGGIVHERDRPADVPDKPSPGVATAAVAAVLPDARACLGPDDPISRANIVFVPTGQVAAVVVTGHAAGTPAEECIRAALSKAKVPAFSQPTYAANVIVRANGS